MLDDDSLLTRYHQQWSLEIKSREAKVAIIQEGSLSSSSSGRGSQPTCHTAVRSNTSSSTPENVLPLPVTQNSDVPQATTSILDPDGTTYPLTEYPPRPAQGKLCHLHTYRCDSSRVMKEKQSEVSEIGVSDKSV
jgi:hypothetical protein